MIAPRQHNNRPKGIVSQASFSQGFQAGGQNGTFRPMPPKVMEHRFDVPDIMHRSQILNPLLVKNCKNTSEGLNKLRTGLPYEGIANAVPIRGNLAGQGGGFGSSPMHPTNNNVQ